MPNFIVTATREVVVSANIEACDPAGAMFIAQHDRTVRWEELTKINSVLLIDEIIEDTDEAERGNLEAAHL